MRFTPKPNPPGAMGLLGTTGAGGSGLVSELSAPGVFSLSLVAPVLTKNRKCLQVKLNLLKTTHPFSEDFC